MPSKVRVGLIGYGYWGPNYARVFSELPEGSLAAICEQSAERLQKALARHPRIRGLADARELFRQNDVDAVVISTPASTHYDLAREALEKGRHVLVEKPLALTVEHCSRLCELAEQTRRTLMVAHTFLYNPGIRKMKECIQSEDFGRLYYVHATRTNLGPIRQDVNALWDLAPHDISIFNYLLEEQPVWASAVGACALGSSREDVGFITLGYSNRVIGNIHVSWADPNKVREVVAVGSRRRVVFDDLNDLERVRIFEKGVSASEIDPRNYGEFKLLVRDGDILSPHIEPSEPLKNQAAEFLASITTNRKPLSSAAAGTDVVRTLVAAEASMQQHGRAVEVQRCSLASPLS